MIRAVIKPKRNNIEVAAGHDSIYNRIGGVALVGVEGGDGGGDCDCDPVGEAQARKEGKKQVWKKYMSSNSWKMLPPRAPAIFYSLPLTSLRSPNSFLILESCSPRRMFLSSCQPSYNSSIFSSPRKFTSLLSTTNFSLCYNAFSLAGAFPSMASLSKRLQTLAMALDWSAGLSVRRFFPAACRVGIGGGVGASSSSDEG